VIRGLRYIAAITSAKLLISVLGSWRAGEILCDATLRNNSSDSVFQSYFKHLSIESSETHYQRSSFKNMITLAKEKEVWYRMS